jgi:UDP-N-acetylglucosamine/UDP-N-acetylgalactosamine diphosphorylase
MSSITESKIQEKFSTDAVTSRWGNVFQYQAAPSEEFLQELASVDLDRQSELYEKVIRNAGGPLNAGAFEPVSGVADYATMEDGLKQEYETAGLKAMADGRLALLILAGGAGTRLGFDHPKGLYNIELPSGRSLFELHCKRLLKLEQISKRRIQLYIMTSPANNQETEDFFVANNYFGLSSDHVMFFSQSMLPCFDNDEGKLMLETPTHLAMAADGNGGIYPAMHSKGVLTHMETNHIDYVHTICIDNALVLGLDPTFMGMVVSQNAEVGSLVVPKRDWQEKIGMLVKKDGKYSVAEYSDVSDDMKQEKDTATGALKFLAGNICIHAYSLDFLKNKVVPNYVQQINPAFFHIAKKQIPVWNVAEKTAVKPMDKNGIKLEMFIFDVFEFADNMAVMQVDRAEQFSPVKNKSGDGVNDSPATARDMFSNLHRSWLEKAGYTVVGDGVVEIDPEVSFRGEGLAGQIEGDIVAPCRVGLVDGKIVCNGV